MATTYELERSGRQWSPTSSGRVGVPFNAKAWADLAHIAEPEARELAAQLDAATPQRPGTVNGIASWNWNSQPQVKEALGMLGFELDSVDDDALAGIEHPFAGILRRYHCARKRASTYGLDWIAKYVAADGRVYTDRKQCGAKTGRMASGSPNLQNIPGSVAYRRCFAAPPGRVLVKADYSQIELRIAATVAGEARMIEAYQRGDDLHTLTARNMTGRQDITPLERKLAKPVNFGLIYGMGVKSLRRKAKAEYDLDLSEEDARPFSRAFFDTYPAIRRWHNRIKRERATGTRTLAGRRVLVEADGFFGAKANYVIQGTGGDGAKEALALLWERREQCPGAFPVLAVHDEIVIEADAAQADAVATWLKAAMVNAMTPLIDPVPVEVEVTVAPTWGG
jgi:DNA polymerase-1